MGRLIYGCLVRWRGVRRHRVAILTFWWIMIYRKFRLGSQAMLLMDLQDILGCKVDIMTEQGLSRLIKDRVLAEAKYFVNFTLKEAV